VLGFARGIARSKIIKRGVVGGKMTHQCSPQEVMNIVLALKKEYNSVVAARGSQKKGKR